MALYLLHCIVCPDLEEDFLAPPVEDEDVPDVQDDVLAQDAGEGLADPLAQINAEENKRSFLSC